MGWEKHIFTRDLGGKIMAEFFKDWGYIYLAAFPQKKGCYKIGSTRDPHYRMRQLSMELGETLLLVSGYTTEALKSERGVQFELNNLSNRSHILCGNSKEKEYIGSERSREFFTFNKQELQKALSIISKYSTINYRYVLLNEWIQ
jgi:hypothetical protein